MVDFARNYNPASEILQFTDVAEISRHNDHDRGKARFMNMRIRTPRPGRCVSAAYAYIRRDAPLSTRRGFSIGETTAAQG